MFDYSWIDWGDNWWENNLAEDNFEESKTYDKETEKTVSKT